MKKTEQLDRISLKQLLNATVGQSDLRAMSETWIFIDSTELNITGKMKVSEFLKALKKIA